MTKKTNVPNAWEDDDWETQADKAAAEPTAPEPAPSVLTKKERLAQHAELNRQLWNSAQEPDNGAPLQYMASASAPPLAQAIKAPMTVLARKPMIAKRDPVTGAMASMSLQDSDDEKDDKPQETPEERRTRQQREREEKQRRYDEARAKIFGETTAPGGGAPSKGPSGRSSGASTPGTVTPPRSGIERRGRGRGRGGYRGSNDRAASGDIPRSKDNNSAGGVSLRDEGRQGELYDPGYSPRPGFTLEKKPGTPGSGRATPRDEDQVIRAPRGPDGGGRSGFGFARRGAND